MADWNGWGAQLLGQLGAPATPQNLKFLQAWQRAEGGSASYNPLNTTQGFNGATSYNSAGVKNYGSASAGLAATKATLLNGRYGNIVGDLRSGHATAAQLATDVANSPWGTGSGVLKVLGSGPVKGTRTTQAAQQQVATQIAGGAPSASQAMAAMLLSSSPGNLFAGQPAQGPGLLDMALARQQLGAAQNVGGAGKTSVNIAGTTIHGVSPSSPHDAAAVKTIEGFLGTPYVWGGESPKGFDCSGLLQYTWAQNGVQIPRTSQQQWQSGTAVSKGALRPGDAVFFVGSDGTSTAPGHVGMYIGDGKFVEAPHTGSTVHISTLAGRTDYVGARRYA